MSRPAMEDALIRSRRLVLRAPRRTDHADWAKLRAGSRAHLEPWEPKWPDDALSRADWQRRLRDWREGWRTGRALVFLCWLAEAGTLLGGASLTHLRRAPALSASLGYWLGADHQGHGYMRESVSALAAWAFGPLGLQRIEAGTLPENTRSRAVLEAVGFREEGFARDYLEIAGRRRDHVLFGLLPGDLERDGVR